ncbi:MAG: Hsp20/alpha crystallin family protein [Anaerolineae bacterium]
MSEKQIEVQEKEVVPEAAERAPEGVRDRVAFIPRADIYETDDDIVVVADMPGVDAESVDITLEDNILSINGYTKDWQPEGYQLTYAEYRVGDYRRRFTLSERIDREGIEAKMTDGVLRLHLPKVEEAKAKKITVQTA